MSENTATPKNLRDLGEFAKLVDFSGKMIRRAWNPQGPPSESVWNPYGILRAPHRNPHGIRMESSGPPIGIRMESVWNPQGPPPGIRMESVWNPYGIRKNSPPARRISKNVFLTLRRLRNFVIIFITFSFTVAAEVISNSRNALPRRSCPTLRVLDYLSQPSTD